MKKLVVSATVLLLITFSSSLQAQIWKKAAGKVGREINKKEPKKNSDEASTRKTSIERARELLADDPCDYTGLSWAEDAFKKGPGKAEAEKMIDNCDSIKRKEAIATLNEDPKNYSARQTLEALLQKNPNDEVLNYQIANSYIQSSPSWKVEEYISKAIESNPSNLDYRWMRIRCNTMSNCQVDDYKVAVEDINYMINNGGKSGKLLVYLYHSENEIAKHWHYKNVPRNTGWSDDTSKQEIEKSKNKKEALKHYKLALDAAENAIEINEKYKDDVDIISLKNSIKELSI